MSWLGAVVLAFAAVVLATVGLNTLAWRRVRLLPRETGPPEGSVSVLIPARDEEHNLPACLEAVLAQGPVVGEVWVYDDRSQDGTARVVEDYARWYPQVHRVQGEELPPGWCGKPHALARLAERASGRFLLFLDADTRLQPGAVAALGATAARHDAGLLSAWPGLVLGSVAERLLMPLLNFVTLSLYPTPVQHWRQDAFLGLAHGACLWADAAAYRRMGGHTTVAGEVFEDTALARAFRAAGERSLCLDGQDVVRVRMYGNFGEIWRGFRKNFRLGFRHEVSFWGFLLLHLGVFLAPFAVAPAVWALGGDARPWALAAVAVWQARLLLAARFRHPVWSALMHPLGEAVVVALGLASWWAITSGRGVEWKGRVYAGRRGRKV